jgi:hypothetical protein
MNSLFSQFEIIQLKAMAQVDNIDEVIHLIDYIDKIQKPDDILEELDGFLEVIKSRKNFIDGLYLHLED